MRFVLLPLAVVALVAAPLPANGQTPTADQIIAKYVQTVGGMPAIAAVKTLKRTGKFTGGGGFEAGVLQDNKRENKVRQEFSIQGMTGVTAYDGVAGWKIEPWQGKKDAEALSEEELRGIVEDADFDDPIIDYARKGNSVTFVGVEQVEGTDALKLKVTLKSGDVRYYYMDTDYYVPIKIELKRMIRGTLQEFEVSLGDYKSVAGWYLPHFMETRLKGSPDSQKITFERIEPNVPLDDHLFERPATGGPTGSSR